jgi:hypothetical protein
MSDSDKVFKTLNLKKDTLTFGLAATVGSLKNRFKRKPKPSLLRKK